MPAMAAHATTLDTIADELRRWARCGDSLPPDRIRLLADLLAGQAETLRLAQLTIDQFMQLRETFMLGATPNPMKEAAE